MTDDQNCADAKRAAGEAEGSVVEIGPLRYARVKAGTFEEMRERVWETDLPQHGDAVLVWVNEGDLYMHAMTGRHTFSSEPPTSPAPMIGE